MDFPVDSAYRGSHDPVTLSLTFIEMDRIQKGISGFITYEAELFKKYWVGALAGTFVLALLAGNFTARQILVGFLVLPQMVAVREWALKSGEKTDQ